MPKNHQPILVTSILIFGATAIVTPNPARADFFRDFNNTLNSIQGTQKNANETVNGISGFLGGQQNNNSNNTVNSADPKLQITQKYSNW